MGEHDQMCASRLPLRIACDCERVRRIRADERERLADLVQMKFSMTSARTHDSTCVCILCAINSTVDAAVDFIRGCESDD